MRVQLLCVLSLICVLSGWQACLEADEFTHAIEADWRCQEKRLNRSPEALATLRGRLQCCRDLLSHLARDHPELDLSDAEKTFLELENRLGKYVVLDAAGRLRLYSNIRWLTRRLALKNPLMPKGPVAFLARRRFICQMLHEYMGYYCDYEPISGGGVYLLDEPGRSFAVTDLVKSRLPEGNYTTLSLSYDARTLFFAFAERLKEKPGYYDGPRNGFHIFSMAANGSGLKQLTHGREDDFDPCPLPDGGLAFMSTRRGGFARCNNPWEPLPTYTLHRMAPEGRGIQTLSLHETHEWHPSILADGRIIYTRWDYVDRSAAHFHGLWASRPDGTNPMALFGNYTQRINACFQPRSIPGSEKIIFIAGAHHADVGGSLVMLDPARIGLNGQTGEDGFDAITCLTPEICFPEAPGWPSSYCHSPWPLSEDFFLVSFSFEPLPGMGPGVKEDTKTGLYLMDRFGNLELLYRREGVSCMYPIPLTSRPAPPVFPAMASATSATLKGDGKAELFVSDVRQSHWPLPEDRPVRALRIFQVLPKTDNHIVNQPRIGYANAESARLLLGTVPVEKDGSAYFRVPARKPVYFQAVDADGRAIQTMRSVTYLQPGERRGCVGCHETPGSVPANKRPLALNRPPSDPVPGPDGSRPWNYMRLVQPVLDKHCVSCHDEGADSAGPALTRRPSGHFTLSYEGLKPFARWYEWGGAGIGGFVTKPGRMPSTLSALVSVLDDSNHAGKTGLTHDARRRLYLWLDGNAAFYGTYSGDAQLAQKAGRTVAVPAVQ